MREPSAASKKRALELAGVPESADTDWNRKWPKALARELERQRFEDEHDWTDEDFDRADRIVKRVVVSCCIGGAAIVAGVTKWAGLW